MDAETGLELAGAVSLGVGGALFLATLTAPPIALVPPENRGAAGLMATGFGMAFVGLAAMSAGEQRRVQPTAVAGAAAVGFQAGGGNRWRTLLGAGALFLVATVLVYDSITR